MIKQNRIEWLDGIKGIACILIFVHHFLLMFYPAVYFGANSLSHLNGFDAAIAQSPFAALINGNYLVMIFCCVSGVVISMQVMQLEDKVKLSDIVAKRYLRLLLPIVPVAVLVFAFMHLDFFANDRVAEYSASEWAMWYYNDKMSFDEFLRSLISTTLIYGDGRISNAFWMLSKLFTGTFLSILLSVISWKYRKRAWIIYAFVCLLFFDNSDFHFAFCLGTLLAWLYLNVEKCFKLVPGIIAILLGLFFGSYPSGVDPDNIYKVFARFKYEDWHAIGAVLTVYGVWSCKFLCKFLSLKVFKFLGKISYAVYVIHIPLEFSLSCALFLLMVEPLGYSLAVAITFVVTLASLVGIAYVYNRFVEKGCVILQNKFFSFLEGRKKDKTVNSGVQI